MKRKNQAFTLVELLIVTAILAILAALLSPVLAQARDQVQSLVCTENLQQVGMAASLYTQDCDGVYAAPNMEKNHWLPDLLNPYIKNWRIWIAPSDPNAQIWDEEWESPSFWRRTSFFWNVYVFQGSAQSWRQAIAQPSIPTPDTLILMGEAYANAGWARDAAPPGDPSLQRAYIHNAYGDSLNTPAYDKTGAACPAHHSTLLNTMHAGGGSYVFADGHAKWLRPDDFEVAALYQTGGWIVNDPTDPLLINGAREASAENRKACDVFCCARSIGMPPGDGERPWFRP